MSKYSPSQLRTASARISRAALQALRGRADAKGTSIADELDEILFNKLKELQTPFPSFGYHVSSTLVRPVSSSIHHSVRSEVSYGNHD